MIVFKFIRETNRFRVYKSDDVEDVGDFSKIYIRNTSDLAEYDELIVVPKED